MCPCAPRKQINETLHTCALRSLMQHSKMTTESGLAALHFWGYMQARRNKHPPKMETMGWDSPAKPHFPLDFGSSPWQTGAQV